MKEDEIKIDLSFLDDLADKIAAKNQMDLFFDNNLLPNTASAGTISQAASSNIWPYVSTGSNTYTLGSNVNGIGSLTLSNGTGWDFYSNTPSSGLKVTSDAEFDGDVKIKGKSIVETLNKIEERLAILHPNKELEDKWEKLKELGDAYRALEKDIQEKEKIWETLKK